MFFSGHNLIPLINITAAWRYTAVEIMLVEVMAVECCMATAVDYGGGNGGARVDGGGAQNFNRVRDTTGGVGYIAMAVAKIMLSLQPESPLRNGNKQRLVDG